MKRKNIFAFLLFLIMIFTSCVGEGEITSAPEVPTETPETSEITETQAPPISLAGYRVVTPATASLPIKNAAVDLKEKLSSLVDGITIANDTKASDGTPEILIGSTDRKESFELRTMLRLGEYAIKYFPESQNIAISGTDEQATLDAIRVFSEVCLNGGTVKSDLLYLSSENLEFSECLLGGVPISEYVLVIPKSADNDEKYASSLISDMIWRKTGINLKITKQASDRSILIGKTGQTPAEFCAERTYAMGMSGENVILCGGGGLTVHAAREFLDKLFPTGENKSSLKLENAKAIAYEAEKLPELNDFGTKPIALADQKNASIAVYDLASGTPELKYEFKPDNSKGFSLKGYENRVDEARLRYSEEWGTYIIGFTSSSGYCAIASYPAEKCMWQTTLLSTSPHSIEYIPGGLVAVACSGGNDTSKGFVRLYSIENKKYAEAKLTSAHALLWDDARQLLWALGATDIVAYEVGSAEEPKLNSVFEYSCSDMKGGHDLSAICGDGDKVWVGGSIVGIFDKTTGKLTDSYIGAAQINKSNVKCICSFPDGSAALTVATGVYASHNTDRFNLFTFGMTVATPTEFVFDGRAFYKARAFIASYN